MAVRVYAQSVAGALRQCEIITDFTRPVLDIETLRSGVVELHPISLPFVIVLSQDCDLEQDYARRRDGKTESLLASVLFCEAEPAEQFREAVKRQGYGRKEWDRVEKNNDPRFHYLRAVPGSCDAGGAGLPALALDFRRYFAMRTEEAYYWLESAARRCRLVSPYAEHLSFRFCGYFGRVGLPLDHHTDGEVAGDEVDGSVPEVPALPPSSSLRRRWRALLDSVRQG